MVTTLYKCPPANLYSPRVYSIKITFVDHLYSSSSTVTNRFQNFFVACVQLKSCRITLNFSHFLSQVKQYAIFFWLETAVLGIAMKKLSLLKAIKCIILTCQGKQFCNNYGSSGIFMDYNSGPKILFSEVLNIGQFHSPQPCKSANYSARSVSKL